MDAAGVWFRNGQVEKAKALLKSLVAEQPNAARAGSLLGRIYVFEGDSDDAIQELKASIDLQDDFETNYFLGIAYLKAKKLAEASAWFHELESRMGESAALHMLFGRAYLIAKLPQQAIPEFRQTIRLDPKYPRAHGFLGYAFKYDVKHLFEENKSLEDVGESRVSERVADLLEAGSAEQKQGAQAIMQQGLPPRPGGQAAGQGERNRSRQAIPFICARNTRQFL